MATLTVWNRRLLVLNLVLLAACGGLLWKGVAAVSPGDAVVGPRIQALLQSAADGSRQAALTAWGTSRGGTGS